MTIKLKILLAFALLVTVLACQFGYIKYIDAQRADILKQMNHTQRLSLAVGQMSIDGQKLRRYEKEYFIYADSADQRNRYIEEWNAVYSRLKNKLAAIEIEKSGDWLADDKDRARQWNYALNIYASSMNTLDRRIRNGEIIGTMHANTAIRDGKNAFRPFLNGTAESLALKMEESDRLVVRYDDIVKKSSAILFMIFGLGLFVSIVLIIIIPQKIDNQINTLERAVSEISRGAVNTPVPVSISPELEKLAKSIERLRVSMRGMLNRLKTA